MIVNTFIEFQIHITNVHRYVVEIYWTLAAAMLCSVLVCLSLKLHLIRNNVWYFSLWSSQDGRTALMFAAIDGRSEMVKLLVRRHKATVDEKDPVRWWKLIIVTKKQYTCVAVSDRNQTLFRCTFQSYYDVRSTVTHNSITNGDQTCCVN